MEKELALLVERLGIDRIKEQISQHAQRSIRAHSQPPAPAHRPGASRLGGLPDLAAGVEWPCLDGTPLAFLAQINLADTAPFNTEGLLPGAGILYFFVDPEQPLGFEPGEQDHWRVLFSESVPVSGPSPVPANLPPESRFKETRLTFAAEWTLPPYESPYVDALNLTDEEVDIFLDAGGDDCQHRLLGHPYPIQGYVPYEVALESSGLSKDWASPEAKAALAAHADWVLLFQVDSDWEANDMMWGDAGMLYFYIRKQDLAERRFDQVWLTMQCG